MNNPSSFLEPQEDQSINGFPLSFRAIQLEDGTVVWVPRGISRNAEARLWRIYVASEDGLFTENIPDNRSSLDALETAYKKLTRVLEVGVSRYAVDKRKRAPGKQRDPVIDTGFTGVVISRSAKENRKVVHISALQAIKGASGGPKMRNRYLGGISEKSFEEDPEGQQRKLNNLLKEAIAVRRYYRQQRGLGIYPEHPFGIEDVPEDILRQPAQLPDLSIEEILDSFAIIPRVLTPKTTGGNPEALAAKLQAFSLYEPHKPVRLEGRYIRFYDSVFGGRVIYKPKQLFRVRNGWRIKIDHRDGYFNDLVSDDEFGGDSDKSLHAAWQYLISNYRALELPEEGRRASSSPLLDTGLSNVVIQQEKRIGKKSKSKRWAFSIKLIQEAGGERSIARSLIYLPLKDLSDEVLFKELKRAAAGVEYRKHLIESGYSLSDAIIDKHTVIPERFWPDEPVCMIPADDFRYYAENHT